MNAPLIRIEVDHMRHSMIHAFSEHMVKMDEQFKHAITEACRPEIVQEIVNDAARRYLKQALDEEVKSFLLHGDGRALISKSVKERLKHDYPITNK